MISKNNITKRFFSSLEANRALVVVSILLCCCKLITAKNKTDFSQNSTHNTMTSSLFSNNSCLQFVSPEVNYSSETLIISTTTRTRNGGFLFSGNFYAETYGFGSAPVGIDVVANNHGSASQKSFLLYLMAEVNKLSLKYSLYTPMFNYASEEKFQL